MLLVFKKYVICTKLYVYNLKCLFNWLFSISSNVRMVKVSVQFIFYTLLFRAPRFGHDSFFSGGSIDLFVKIMREGMHVCFCYTKDSVGPKMSTRIRAKTSELKCLS